MASFGSPSEERNMTPPATTPSPASAPDLAAGRWASDPWAAYREWRSGGDVRWSPTHRSWFVFGHGPVCDGLRSTDLRADYPFRATRQALGPTIVDLEGEDHTRLRPPTSSRLSTHHLEHDAKEWLDELVDERVDAFVDGGGGDVVSGLAIPVVTAVVAQVLGFPHEDAGWVYDTLAPINRYLDTAAGKLADADAARSELEAYLRQVIRSGRMTERGALQLLATSSDDGMLSEQEAVSAGILLLAAGTETSIGTLSNAVDALCRFPEQQARLRSRELSEQRFVKEVLRWEAPMHFSIRHTVSDVELAGTTIRAGSIVQLCLASANRDEAVFADPDRFDPDRPSARILTFGYGRHACPGTGLAQAEVTAAVRRLVSTTSAIEHAGPSTQAPGLMFRRPLALPVSVR
ncbi:MAG: cytochrome P450 [Patulibacter sp.]